MKTSSWLSFLVLALAVLLAGCAPTAPPQSAASPGLKKAQITVLYDAFGKTSTMKKDWGFAALIEYGGKRILFDTGNDAEIFAHNVKAKGVDLTKLDFVVMSHRHGDHMGGLNYLLASIRTWRSTHRRRTSASLVHPFQGPSTGATNPCLLKCATLTGNRLRRCALAPRGRRASSPG